MVILKFRILKNYLKIRVLKIKFEIQKFGKVFENGTFEN